MLSIGFRVLNDHQRSDAALVQSFAGIPTAIISDNLNRLVAAGPRLRPLHRSGVLSGCAVTVRTRPGDNLMIHKAADIARPGDVIVVDGGGDLTNALIGELIIAHARSRGVTGFVIDGAARDLDSISEGDFPVYAAGVSHRGPYKDGPGEVNCPISLSGMIVSPGDIIIGDADGVVCIPREGAEGVLAACRAQCEREAKILSDIGKGAWDRTWVDATLREKGCEGV